MLQFHSRDNKVSERSLEFNVLNEMIECTKRYFRKAYIVGYTTRQEAHHGLDVSINIPGYMLSAYQFKAPTSCKSRAVSYCTSYTFTIGNRCWVCSNPYLRHRGQARQQIINLLSSLGLRESCINQHTLLYVVSLAIETYLGANVYYAFPLVYDYYELEQRIPGITNYTVTIRVRDFPISTILDCKSHRVEITLLSPISNIVDVVVYSKPTKIPSDKIRLAAEVVEKDLKDLKRRPRTAIHIKPEDLLDMLTREFIHKAEEEDVGKDLMERAESLAKALVGVSFSYRGLTIAVEEERT